MANIKSLDRIAAKYGSVTPQRSQDYADGIANPRRSWSQGALAAEQAFKEGVTAAATAGRFGKGVRAAGDGKWLDGATKKGVQRWGPGVQMGQDRYQQGFAPYASAIGSATLPPRYKRRDPRNLERVRAVVEAVSRVKEAAAK